MPCRPQSPCSGPSIASISGRRNPSRSGLGWPWGTRPPRGDDLFGTPVVEAARLCSRAEAGQNPVHRRDQGRGREPVGWRVRLGGDARAQGPAGRRPHLRGPVGTARGPHRGGRDGGLPLPRLLTSTHRVPFAGREAELAALEKAWAVAESGERTTALLAGEPGIGKSRLTAELGQRAHADGAMVLLGRCDDELGVPFQPFVEALDFFVEHCAPEQISERLGPHPGELVRLVPGSPISFPTYRRPSARTAKPSACACSTRSMAGCPPSRPRPRPSSCSTTFTGRPDPRSSSSGTSCAQGLRATSSWSAPTGTPTSTGPAPSPRCSPTSAAFRPSSG